MGSTTVPANTALQRIASKIGVDPDLIEDAYPCTSLQISLMTASLHGTGNYVSTFVFELSKDSPNLQDLKTACEHLYECTPVLRTRFIQSKGSFLQVVVRKPLEWQEHNNLEKFLGQDTKEVKLGDPLANFIQISESEGKTYLVLSLHHALYDEWSIDLLFQDLSTLAAASTLAIAPNRRPKFSKFIKALSQVNQSVSKTFWRRSLAHLEKYSAIFPNVADTFETCRQVEYSRPVQLSPIGHQLSTLAIAAWSITVAKLSGSDTVVFGNIVNGRAAQVPGILDICGPTMTTIPYMVDVPWKDTARSFLDKLEHFRSESLPHEQTGLDEYRRMRGFGRFDTLLSIRFAQESTPDAEKCHQLRPNTMMGRQIRHPCCIYLDIVLETKGHTLKASFDEHYINADAILKILEQISTCLEELTSSLDATVGKLAELIKTPKLVLPPGEHKADVSMKSTKIAVDPELLSKVQKVAQETSGGCDMDRMTPQTSLRELGFDSLSNVVFARRLSEVLQISLPFREITGLRKTMSDITQSVQAIKQGMKEESSNGLNLSDLAEHYAEGFQQTANMLRMETAPTSILLTGATGYVGIMILKQLLTTTENPVILLIRCKSSKEGTDRIRKIAKAAQWNKREINDLDRRVLIWPSDLGAPQLGLTTKQLDQFDNIQTIIHNGAQVNFSLAYQDLEATNVAATAFLLKNFLNSSMSSFVYVTGGRSCPLDLDETLETTASKLATANGYAQSKFVSELLLHHAHKKRKENALKRQMTIVHPGIVIGNETTAVANTDDFVWRYVAASIQMRAYVPAVPTKREWINLMTVDSVARETVAAATEGNVTDKVERRLMRSGLSVARFWEVVIEALNLEGVLEPVSEWEWLHILQDELSKKGVKHPLFSLSQMILQGFLKGIGGVGPRPEDEPPREDILASERAVAANAKYLQEVDFFLKDEGDALDAEVFGRSRR